MCHELGHYVTARWYQLDVSPPYFIPVPLIPSFIGTMGAFIRLRTLLSDRRQLLDVGVAGPLAGFAIALPVLWIGLALSHPPPGHGELSGMLLAIGNETFGLGDSLVTLALRELTHGGTRTLLLHPLAFAGWVGMFVTMLNLLPISQLDGGHILYAALPRWHARAALMCWAVILALGWYWKGWLVVGIGRADSLTWTARAPARARCLSPPASLASLARVGGAGAAGDHVCSGAVQNLKKVSGVGVRCQRRRP